MAKPPLLSYNKASFIIRKFHYQSVKEALLLNVGTVFAAKHRKNSKLKL